MKKYLFLIFIPIFGIILLIFSPVMLYKNAEVEQSLVGVGVFVDPGHGGYDPGTSREEVLEKDINLEIGKLLFEMTLERGSISFITRVGDYDLSKANSQNHKRDDLLERARQINNSGASLLVSLHLNATKDTSIKGPMVYFRAGDPASAKLATKIQDQLNIFSGLEKITHPERYYLFRNTSIPAVLVECGFMSNQEEKRSLLNASYQRGLAESIYLGIAHFMDVAG